MFSSLKRFIFSKRPELEDELVIPEESLGQMEKNDLLDIRKGLLKYDNLEQTTRDKFHESRLNRSRTGTLSGGYSEIQLIPREPVPEGAVD